MDLKNGFYRLINEYQSELMTARESKDYKWPFGTLVRHDIMISEKEEKESSDNLNFILNVLTIVSSVSAIFQVVDYWVNSAKTRIPSILANVIILVPLVIIIVVRKLVRKRNKK